jgi:hypothetical protein
MSARRERVLGELEDWSTLRVLQSSQIWRGTLRVFFKKKYKTKVSGIRKARIVF